MPQEPDLSHRVVRNAALPYVSHLSPTTTDPCYIPGSQNILTSVNNYAERRPGFSSTVESTPTTFNNLQRQFTWDRTNGSFFVMFCDINASGFAQVYKMQVGVDASAVSLFTDTVGTPFDFVVSNNTVYFSNGHVAKKWDPINGLSNWGIAIGSVNNATGPNTAGAGATAGSGNAWINPGNVNSAVSFATSTVTLLTGTANLQATTFGFALSAETILGIQVSFDAESTTTGIDTISAILLKNGVAIGVAHTSPLTNSIVTYTFGGSADLWGSSWTINDINQTNFGVQIVGFRNNFNNTSTTVSVRHVQVTVFGLGGPSIVVSASAGTFSAVTGYQYVFCYGNSNTGHLSSPTPPSNSTGVFTSKLNVQVSLTASLDAQVNQIRVFRSTDSVATGTTAAVYFELPTSPYPNTTANITDNAADNTLIVANVAPTATFNDPPTPGQSPVYFSGRIWMFSGNKVWFSGLEEILLGVPEESWPSGVGGNFWAFDQPVQALAVAGTGNNQVLLIFCGGRLYGITGFTLDTFQRSLLSNRRGCRNLIATSSLGGMVAWLDSANQIWATDGSSLQELGLPIRPDVSGVTPANCSMTFHAAGVNHWLVFSTGAKLFVYDIDTEQWMPPWSFACQHIFSGETAPGSYQLMASTATKALQLGAGHNDNSVTYSFVGQTNLYAMVPDFGNRFSYIAAGIYDEPSRTGMPWAFQVDTNAVSLSDVLFIQDDDPLNASSTYTSIVANLTSPSVAYNRPQGTFLVQNIYPVTQPYSRWIGWKIIGATADDDLRVYGFFTAYQTKR